MNRVVIFAVDGVRLDRLDRAATAAIDRIARQGWFTPVQVSDEAPTLSGPCWATVATGVTPHSHGIYSNVLDGHSLDDFPDVLTQVRARGGHTYLAATWAPLATSAAGGPIFGPATRQHVVEADLAGRAFTDDGIAADAASALGTGDFDASFVYFGAPDSVAHAHGTGAEYIAAIEDADRRVGQVLDAIADRPTYPDEQWTIIVVTDHGHRDEGGHGGSTEAERTAWIAACGRGAEAHG
jgi:predicted AlkP superfamily pyrophosphatase or phosphodiesterase